MMKKHIFIHIGMHKTASSALQGFLTHNAEALNNLGVSYPFPEARSVVKSGACTGNLMHVVQSQS